MAAIESFYSHAVRIGHSAACISFENYAERPAAMWAEESKTPTRLRIGSAITWDGLKLEVTNLQKDRLIACHYEHQHVADELKPGTVTYFSNGYREIKRLKQTPNSGLDVRFSAAIEGFDRKPKRVFRITYAELRNKRLEHERRVKDILNLIAKSKTSAEITAAELDGIYKPGRLALFRSFDIVAINHAITAKKNQLRGAA